MARVTRRPAARADLIEIYRYIAQVSPERAAAYLRRIDRKIALLAEQPGMGAARLPGHPEIRVSPVGSHLLFYQPLSGGGIDLVRVLHGARDWHTIMDGDPGR